MTHEGKFYWLRKKGTDNQPGQKHGWLFGTNARGKAFITQKPAAANVYKGGDKLNQFLLEHPECEPVEVVQKGTKSYHKRTVANWVPVVHKEHLPDDTE